MLDLQRTYTVEEEEMKKSVSEVGVCAVENKMMSKKGAC